MGSLTPEQELELIRIRARARKRKAESMAKADAGLRSELSAMSPKGRIHDRAAEFDALPFWKKPLVAADDLATIAGDTITFGYGAKGIAKAREAMGKGSYDSELAMIRNSIGDSEERAGLAGLGTKGVTLLAPAKAGVTLMQPVTQAWTGIGGLLGRMGLMSAEGAGYGALSAAGHDEDIKSGATTGAVFGAGGQLVGEGVGAVLGKLLSKYKTEKAIPIETLNAQKKAAYDAADNLGVQYAPEALDTLKTGIADDMSANLMDPITSPNTNAVFKALMDRINGEPKSLAEVEQFRKIAGKKIYDGNSSKEDARLGKMVIDNIDEFIDSAGPNQVVSGNPEAAAETLRRARDLHVKTSKLEKIDEAVRNAELRTGATGSGGNIDNALRQEMARFLKNKRTSRQFRGEADMIEKISKGSPMANMLRLGGKLAPTGVVSAGLSSSMGAGAGSMIGGPPGAMLGSLVVPAIGGLSKKLADRSTRKGVEELARFISTGKAKETGKELSEPVRELLARAILAAGLPLATTQP